MRGGLRSHIAQEWLRENGKEVPLVLGGYKKLRNHCIKILDRIEEIDQNWIIIGGRTGSGKTKLIKKISNSIFFTWFISRFSQFEFFSKKAAV